MPRKKREAATLLERKGRALTLRKAGVSYSKIGEELGVSTTQACRDVHSVLRKLAEENDDNARELRQLESERLDSISLALYPKAQKGNKDAIAGFLKTIEIRCKLFGLNMQSKQQMHEIEAVKILVDAGWLTDEVLEQIEAKVGRLEEEVKEIFTKDGTSAAKEIDTEEEDRESQ